MKWEQFLESILDKKQIKKLKQRMKSKSTVFYIPYVPAKGKTTLVNVLLGLGYTVYEESDTCELKLKGDMSNRVSGVDKAMMTQLDEIKEWIRK